MKPVAQSSIQSVARLLAAHFPALGAVDGFDKLHTGDDEGVETGDWQVTAASGLRSISLYFRGAGLIEVACSYRDRREEFEFFTSEVKEEEVAQILIRFLEMVLALPKNALSGKCTIREVLDYRECKGIY